MTSPAQASQNRPAQNQGSTQGGSKKGQRGKPREVQQFPADAFQIKRPQTVAERSEYKRKRVERSDQQKLVDGLVWDIYQDWINAGRPRKFVDIPLAVWPVPLNLEEDARHMLQKAATLFQRTLRYGDCPTVAGKIELAFYVVDRQTEVEGAPS